jgi:chromosome partitioning protein
MMAEIFEISSEGKRGKPDDLHNFKDGIGHNVAREITGLERIPSQLKLTFLDLDLAARPGRERILGRSLDKVRGDYDMILCDCPPRSKHRSPSAQSSAPDRFVPV